MSTRIPRQDNNGPGGFVPQFPAHLPTTPPPGFPTASPPSVADHASTPSRDATNATPIRTKIRHNRDRWSTSLYKKWHAIAQTARKKPVVAAIVNYLTCVTPAGYCVIGAAIVSWWLACAYDWREAWAGAIIFTGVVLVAHLWLVRRDNVQTELSLNHRRVSVGDDIIATLRVWQDDKPLMPGLVITLPVGTQTRHFSVPRLQAGDSHKETITIPTCHRGVVSVGPITSSRNDPLMIIRQHRRWAAATDVYVHPKTVTVGHSAVGFLRDIEGATTRILSSSDVAFHALRDYVPGDERRAIHWKSTAKTGKLMVRQFEETRRAHLLLVLSQNPALYTGRDEFELAVSTIASIAVQAFREGKTVSVCTDDTVVHQPNAGQVLDLLTVVNPCDRAQPLPELMAKAVGHIPAASVVISVSGARTTMTELHNAHARMSIAMAALMIRSVTTDMTDDDTASPWQQNTPQAGRSHRIGAMTVLDVGTLDSLPAMLRKVNL